MEEKRKERRNAMQLLTMVTQFGITMLVPIFLCFFLGRVLDKRFGTAIWTIILFFVGAVAGFRNIYVLSRRYFQNNDKECSEDILDPAQHPDRALDRDPAVEPGDPADPASDPGSKRT
ncbi:MAG: AtpZ/AtpI family protein [Lachnospiraceae bacterium]|nr:AtpZ/AtpI family protein [Lachnospiraceae bacterium]